MNLADMWKVWKLYNGLKTLKGRFGMGKYNSRKLVAVLVAALVTTANAFFGSPIEPSVIEWFLGTISVYIVGQAAVDAVEKNAAKPAK
jgi:hypothetical protein